MVLESFWRLRDWWRGLGSGVTSAEEHERRVRYVQEQVSAHASSGKNREPLCTARRPWMTISQRTVKFKTASNSIQLDALCDVLELNADEQYVRVEPLVSVGRLTHFLLPKGWTLPLVPEMDDLTMGGLYFGYGIESSSHRAGLFADIVLAAEVVLADGSVVRATEDNEHAELFAALPWSYGSLGFLVALELRVIPARRYVKLHYRPIRGLKKIVDEFTRTAEADNAPMFLETLLYSKQQGVMMTGELTDHAASDGVVNSINLWHKPLFFRHVESKLDGPAHFEYVPLRHYYHRHTRGIFWFMDQLIPFSNQFWFRWLLGWLIPPSVQMLKLTQGEAVRKFYENMSVSQDVLVPIHRMQEMIEWCDKEYKIYPVWLCPHLTIPTKPHGMLVPSDGGNKAEMWVDVGIYGIPELVRNDKEFSHRKSMIKLQKYLRSIKGVQALYAVTEMTEAEFRDMFNHSLWEKMRKLYGAEGAFLTPYQKTSSK